jgi:cell fate (sporulation/competence/biofilm development) regulator YlbF (YheA/YmcA/DUF963 family)
MSDVRIQNSDVRQHPLNSEICILTSDIFAVRHALATFYEPMLEDKAKELGRLIGQSPEYKAVKRANDELAADRETLTLLRELERLREEAQMMIARGEHPTEEMERKLDELLGKVQGNRAYQSVAVAQENFDKLMMRANEWILEGIKKGAQSPIITLS